MVTVSFSDFKLNPANTCSQQNLFLAGEEKKVLSRHIMHKVHSCCAQHTLRYPLAIITGSEKRFNGDGQGLNIHLKTREVKS